MNSFNRKVFVVVAQVTESESTRRLVEILTTENNIGKCMSVAKTYARDNPGKYAEVYELKYRYRMEDVKETKYGE